jgi:hypothetical protein
LGLSDGILFINLDSAFLAKLSRSDIEFSSTHQPGVHAILITGDATLTYLVKVGSAASLLCKSFEWEFSNHALSIPHITSIYCGSCLQQLLLFHFPKDDFLFLSFLPHLLLYSAPKKSSTSPVYLFMLA